MFKFSWFAAVLAVICLPVILLSVEADAQLTVDETTQYDGSNTLEEVATDIRDEIRGVKEHVDTVLYLINDEIADVKTLLAPGSRETNDTGLEDVVNMVKAIASNQQQNAQEIRDYMKRLLVSERLESNDTTRLEEVANDIKDEMKDIKTLLVSGCGATNRTRLEEVVNEIKDQMTNGFKDVTNMLESGSGETNATTVGDVVKEIRDEIKDVKKLLALLITETNEAKNVTDSLKCDAGNTSTLACKYITARAIRFMSGRTMVCDVSVCWLHG